LSLKNCSVKNEFNKDFKIYGKNENEEFEYISDKALIQAEIKRLKIISCYIFE